MASHNLMEREKKRLQTYRRNLLHLIVAHLKEEGYTKSSQTLAEEAQLPNDVQVCDNIDLELILQDFSSYYHMRFNKYPMLCKRVDESSNANGVDTKKPAKTFVNRNDIKKTEKNDGRTQLAKSVSEEDLNLAVTITSIFPEGNSGGSSMVESPEKPGYAKILKSIEELYPKDSELGKLAEDISREIVLKNLNVRWEDVIGLDDCKQAVREAIVYPIKYPIFFKEKFKPWRGILLHGPPGTGKTMLAKAAATECNCTFFNITASSLISKWRGDSEKYVRILLDLAYHLSPTIIFVDEIDWIAPKTNDGQSPEAARRFRSEILSRLDGLGTSETSNVMLLAATNALCNIDKALLRRLEKQISVEKPNEDSRRLLLEYHVSKAFHGQELATVVARTAGFSCADIKLLCKEAWMRQIRPFWGQFESDASMSFQTMTYEITDMEFLYDALAKMNPTTDAVAKTNPKTVAVAQSNPTTNAVAKTYPTIGGYPY